MGAAMCACVSEHVSRHARREKSQHTDRQGRGQTSRHGGHEAGRWAADWLSIPCRVNETRLCVWVVRTSTTGDMHVSMSLM